MGRLLRFGLLWVLAVAMPLQALAAADMLGCAGHHQAAADRSMPTQEDTAGHGAHHPHHVGSATTADESMAGPTMAAPGDGGETPLHAAGHSCSACAACCAGFALLNAPVTVVAPEPAAGVGKGSSPQAASALEDAPERPPRALRA